MTTASPSPMPLLSALEVAMQGVVELPTVRPLRSEVDVRAASYGGDRITATRMLMEEAAGRLDFLRTILPHVAREIEQARAEAECAWVKASVSIGESFSAVKNVEALLSQRASLLAEIEQDQHRLEHAQATSADASIITLSSAEQLALSNLVKHLPGTIREKQARASALAGEITGAAQTLGLDLAVLVQEIYKATKTPDGRVLDTGTRSHVEHGYYKV